MADDFAERFAFEPSRVVGIVKALRDAGLIKAGPRGVNAPDATPLDAARILIGMMLRVKQHEVAEGVALFGSFPLWSQADPEHKAPATSEQALAKVLEIYGAEGIERGDGNQYDFSIVRDFSYCSLVVSTWLGVDDAQDPRWEDASFTGYDEVELRYLHPETEPSAAEAKPSEELLKSWRRYRSGFHEIPQLNCQDLFEIGQVLAGHQPPLEPAT